METEQNQQQIDPTIPVVCDIDGTLIHSDLLYESLLDAVKRKPTILFLIPFWLLKGRSYLKNQLAQRSKLNIQSLPFNEEILAHLKYAKLQGRRVVLASASDGVLVRAVADKIANKIGGIDEVIGSTPQLNLKGSAKAAELLSRFGEKGFEYIGDSSADFAVWQHAKHVGVVSSRASFIAKVESKFPSVKVYSKPIPSIKSVVRALRVYQWLKNLLVFLPLLLAHRIWDGHVWIEATVALICFSLCASGVYIINDLLDLESDRAHHRKRHRPFASGALPIQYAFVLAPALFLIGLPLAYLLSSAFFAVLIIYLFLTTLYSFRLKQIAIVDLILLAMLYTIRIIGGGVATEVHVSQWLLGIAMFIFLSLACVKRFSELLTLREKNERQSKGRGYLVEDMEQVAMFGAASGYISVLVLALYVSSKEVIELYSHPQIIWLGCPLMLYWISRVWLLARRGAVHDDPLVFAMRDKVTYIVGFIALIIFGSAKW